MAKEENKNTDDFPGEEEIIPAGVMEVMERVEKENETIETEAKEKEVVEAEEKETEEVEEKETETEETETEEKETETKDEETEPIPQEQINIARRLGWSDERIVEVAENNPEILEDMATLAGRQIQQPQVQTEKPAAKKEQVEVKGLEKVTLDEAALTKMKETYGDDVVNEVILPLTKSLNLVIDQSNTLRGSVDGVERANSDAGLIREYKEANTAFDELGKTFEVFGKTKELPVLPNGLPNPESAAVQTRSQVYDVAQAFKASGMNWTKALQNAERWYKGEHAEKSLERKIIKDLNSRKKKFSPRPTSKKTKEVHVSREDEGVALVRKAYKKD